MPCLLSGSRPHACTIIQLYFSQQHPFYSNRLTELNLREVYQMVMLTLASCMKYLTYSGLNKIVHLHRDLTDVNRCPWGGARESHVGQLPD